MDAFAPRIRVLEETARTRKLDLGLRSDDGRDFRFFVREPLRTGRLLPAIFLLAGFETGRESLDLIDERSDVVLLGMDYPYDGPEPRGLNVVRALPALRRMARETLDAGNVALDYLEQRDDTDPGRIILVGVSFGSIFVAALAGRDARPDAVVLIYGGGDLGAIARHNFARPWLPGPLVSLVVDLLFGHLDPLHHVGKIAPRRLLMVNSTEDEMIPEEAARKLFEAAGEPKKLVWYETGHMDLFDREVVRSLVDEVVRELEAAGMM